MAGTQSNSPWLDAKRVAPVAQATEDTKSARKRFFFLDFCATFDQAKVADKYVRLKEYCNIIFMETPLINILTFGLPYKLANQIYNEYESRLSEAKYIMKISDRYRPLIEYTETVEILLALTIFHKRVIANLNAGIKFYGTVNRYSQAETIKIGSYDFSGEEKNKILGLIINYERLRKRFGIPANIVNYELTKEFLRIVVSLLQNFKYGEENGQRSEDNKEDFPF